MEITTQEFRVMNVEMGEYEALTTAEQTLAEVQNAFGTETTLMNAATGEIISGEEIARARAILTFIAQVRVVEIV